MPLAQLPTPEGVVISKCLPAHLRRAGPALLLSPIVNLLVLAPQLSVNASGARSESDDITTQIETTPSHGSPSPYSECQPVGLAGPRRRQSGGGSGGFDWFVGTGTLKWDGLTHLHYLE